MSVKNTNTHEQQDQQEETPLCLRCLRPMDPLSYYCPHCGEATGQLTPYLPFVNIPWQTRIWGQMWRQVWAREAPVAGSVLRLCMILCYAPVLLIGLLFRPWQATEPAEQVHAPDEDRRDEPDG